MSNNVLGKGFRFPCALDLTGGVSFSSGDDNVRESIFIILSTAPGERVGRPDFGCRLQELLFMPNDRVTASLAEMYCHEAILKHEPRVAAVTVTAGTDASSPNRLNLRITFTVRGEHHERSMVFPFYLNQDEGATR